MSTYKTVQANWLLNETQQNYFLYIKNAFKILIESIEIQNPL